MPINETHDPNLRSWVESANDPGTDFPIQNLPWCAFTESNDPDWIGVGALGIAIGDQIVHLPPLSELFEDLDDTESGEVFFRDFEDCFLTGPLEMRVARLSAVRLRLSQLLRADNPKLKNNRRLVKEAFVPQADVRLMELISPPNYTDFYASKHHASTVGAMFRPDNPLLPNYTHVPIGYHGRASSIVVSGTPITRPSGQTKADDAAAPTYGPCKMLDYELEIGLFIGRGNTLGEPIPIEKAHEHIFGLCLVNDWSARDIQKWEYQPLGPFLAKNFGTSISPYIVTLEALEPFRIPGPRRGPDDPQPLPYLRGTGDWNLDITLEVYLASQQMRDRALPPVLLSRGSFADMYWTIDQLVAHHASNGCNLQPGDLLASGTVSGPAKESRGCLLEQTWDGTGKPRVPIHLPSGETRLFLQDGDEVIFKGYCEREGFRRIGFGECRGIVVPAKA